MATIKELEKNHKMEIRQQQKLLEWSKTDCSSNTASSCPDAPSPAMAILRTAAWLHGREHTWIASPVDLMVGEVIQVLFAEQPPKRVAPFGLLFLLFAAAQGWSQASCQASSPWPSPDHSKPVV